MSTSSDEFTEIMASPPINTDNNGHARREFPWRGDTARLRSLEYKCKMHELIIHKIFQRISNFVTLGEVEGALVLRETVKQDVEKLLDVHFLHFKERLEDIADKNYVDQSLAQKISKEEWTEHLDQQNKMYRILEIALAKYQTKDKQTQCELLPPASSLAERYQEVIDQMDHQQSMIIDYEEEIRDLNYQLSKAQNRIQSEQQFMKQMHSVTKTWTSIKDSLEREMERRENEIQQKLERIVVDVYERCDNLESKSDKQFAKLVEFEEFDPRNKANVGFWSIIEKNLNHISSMERSMISATEQQQAVENLYAELMDITKNVADTQKVASETLTKLKTSQELQRNNWEQQSDKIEKIFSLQT